MLQLGGLLVGEITPSYDEPLKQLIADRNGNEKNGNDEKVLLDIEHDVLAFLRHDNKRRLHRVKECTVAPIHEIRVAEMDGHCIRISFLPSRHFNS